MRGLVVAVVGSVIVHTGALAWIASSERGEPRGATPALAVTPAPAVAPAPTPPPPDPPIEVTFFTYRGNAGASGAVGSASQSEPPVAPAKRGRFTTGAGSATGETAAPPGRSPLMTMRRPGDEAVRGISGRFLEDFMNNTKPLPPPPDIPGERIGDQIAAVRSRLARAGRYSPEELAAMRAELVALNAQREAEELKPAGGGTFRTEKETFRAKVAADGSVKLEDKPENMDAQDRMMLRRGIDPYAKAKLDYLDRTRDQRVAIGKRHRSEQLKKSVIYMQQHVARLFATTADPAQHKQGLFELWDECSETGTAEEIAGGEAARAFVMAVIRAKVRYTAAELRELNAKRHSRQPFAP